MPGGSNAILSEEELAAALAEVEQLAGTESQIPSLEEAAAPAPILVPVPNIQPPATPDAAPPPAAAVAPAAPSATPVAAAIPKTAAAPAVSKPVPATASAPPADAASSSAGAGARRTIGQIVYGACDALLDWINWPFVRLGEATRGLIGTLSVVTMITSLLALTVLPMFHPDRDPLGFLRRRPPPAPPASADSGHGAAPKAESHGGGH